MRRYCCDSKDFIYSCPRLLPQHRRTITVDVRTTYVYIKCNEIPARSQDELVAGHSDQRADGNSDECPNEESGHSIDVGVVETQGVEFGDPAADSRQRAHHPSGEATANPEHKETMDAL